MEPGTLRELTQHRHLALGVLSQCLLHGISMEWKPSSGKAAGFSPKKPVFSLPSPLVRRANGITSYSRGQTGLQI